MKNVTIIDYGMGNIKSLFNSLKFLGYNPVFFSEQKSIKSNICILPGVGAFNQAMKLIKKKQILNDLETYTNNKDNILLGICLGMQMAVIEYARNVLLHPNANSTEIDENTDYPVIGLMESQKGVVNKGGTMRLGTWNCDLAQGSKVAEVYGKQQITERHRHRFEFNNEYKKEVFEKGTLKVSEG